MINFLFAIQYNNTKQNNNTYKHTWNGLMITVYQWFAKYVGLTFNSAS